MEKELKEGDEVVLRGKVKRVVSTKAVEFEYDNWGFNCETKFLHKVRPGTYQVAARDVAKMITRACRERKMWSALCLAAFSKDNRAPLAFKKLQRWVHCRLRELRRKRKQ